jgi:hypothetical protein
MVDRNDSLLREVEDELRHDKFKKLWDQYGTYVLGAAIAFVIGVFVYQQVAAQRLAAAQAAGTRFEVARRLATENKAPEAAAAFAEIAKSGPAGYATLARFQQAAAAGKTGATAEAVAAYDAIVASGSDAVLRDLARLQAAALRLDTGDWTEMQNRLNPVTDERNAFRANARELLGLAARKADKNEDARRLFLQVLGDSKASQPLKDRVTSYLAALTAGDLSKQAAPAAPAEAPAAKP